MISNKFLRRFLVSGVVIGSGAKINSVKCDPVCRASELPIYINEEENRTKKESELCPPKQGVIENVFGTVRKQIWSVCDQMYVYQKDMENCVHQSSDSVNSMYKYLSEESDDTTRMAAVGVGALAGFVLGLRGGFIRRLFYSGLGAYGMSAVCYPKQTKEYTQSAIKEGRIYATIAYNFVYGVKKDDIPLPQLPKLPSSMGEMWEMAGELGKSATSLISGVQQSEVPAKPASKEGIAKSE